MEEPVPVWMCMIETNDPNNGWRLECAFPARSQPKANLIATRIIVKDLWADSYLDIPEDDNDILDKIVYTEQHGGKFVTEFHSDKEFIEDVRVTIWEAKM